MFFQRARGTSTTPLYLNDNDTISSYNMKGFDEASEGFTGTIAYLRFSADGQHDIANFGTKVKFGTNEGTGNATDRMIIDKDGKVGIGVHPLTNLATGDLVLEGGSIVLKEITTPTADTNYGKVYTKTDNKLYFQDGAGTEHEIAFV